jgi:hypothetical protein
MKNVFVYGTLLDDRIAKGLLGRLPKHVPARLHDFARYRVNKAAFPAIVTQQQACVDGRVSLITVNGKCFAWAFSGSSGCRVLLLPDTLLDSHFDHLVLFFHARDLQIVCC